LWPFKFVTRKCFASLLVIQYGTVFCGGGNHRPVYKKLPPELVTLYNVRA
jgi:hypothetical protein